MGPSSQTREPTLDHHQAPEGLAEVACLSTKNAAKWWLSLHGTYVWDWKIKKEYVYDVIKEKKIDICLLQEVEIPVDYDTNLLSHREFRIETETNCVKSRTAIIINENIQYERQKTLKKEDRGIIIIDLNGPEKYRIINVYRSFNPQNNETPLNFFVTQLDIISNAIRSSNGM